MALVAAQGGQAKFKAKVKEGVRNPNYWLFPL
jgi:hypothetical protein